MIDMNDVNEYIELSKTKKNLEEELKGITERMAEMEDKIIDFFASNGMQNVRANNRTISIATQLWASLKDKDLGCQLLKMHGYGDLVSENVNHQRLSSWIRDESERDETLESLPQDIRDVIRITKKVTLRVTR
jgi:hypothetical protein